MEGAYAVSSSPPPYRCLVSRYESLRPPAPHLLLFLPPKVPRRRGLPLSGSGSGRSTEVILAFVFPSLFFPSRAPAIHVARPPPYECLEGVAERVPCSFCDPSRVANESLFLFSYFFFLVPRVYRSERSSVLYRAYIAMGSLGYAFPPLFSRLFRVATFLTRLIVAPLSAPRPLFSPLAA